MDNADSDARLERQLAVALKSEPETWTADCLEPDQMVSLAEHSLPESASAPLLAHVALCARCRREYAETVELMQLAEEVRALEAEVETPPAVVALPAPAPPAETPARTSPERDRPRIPFWQRWFTPGFGFAFGAAAAGIALFFAATVPAREQRDKLASLLKERDAQIARRDQERKNQEQEREQELAALKLQNQGNSSRLAQEIDRLNRRIKGQGTQIARLSETETALEQMPLPTPEWRLAQESSRLRGGNEPDTPAPEIQLISPVEMAVPEDRPALEFRPVSGATEYQVSLEKEGSNEEPPPLQTLGPTRRQPAKPLQPGSVYKWAVTARRGNQLLHSPVVKFYVLSEAQKREIAAARRKYAGNPLALGTVYARLGLTTEAEQQFRAAVKTDQSRPLAQRWLQELQAQRRRH